MKYHELRIRSAKEKLNAEEARYLKRVEALIGYRIKLLLPLGGEFILGADDAEKILERLGDA